jgi:hypothetical protein
MLKILKNTIQSYKRRRITRRKTKIYTDMPKEEKKALESVINNIEGGIIKPNKPKQFNIEVHYEYEIQTFEVIHYEVREKHITMKLEGNKTIILPYKKLFIEEIK